MDFEPQIHILALGVLRILRGASEESITCSYYDHEVMIWCVYLALGVLRILRGASEESCYYHHEVVYVLALGVLRILRSASEENNLRLLRS